MSIVPRDLVIFEVLHEYRALRTITLHAIVQLRFGRKSHFDTFRDRLAQLRHFGYLKLPDQQFQYDNCKYAHDIYALDKPGFEALRKTGMLNFDGRVIRNGEFRRSHIRSLAHALQVCDIISDFEIGAARLPNVRFMSPIEIQARFPVEKRGDDRPFQMPAHIQFLGRSSRLNVEPDSIIGLEYTVGSKKYYRALLVEANQNTEPAFSLDFKRKSHLREVLAYQDIAKRGTYKVLNLPNMLVLNVSVSETGQNALKRANKEGTKGKGSSVMLYRHIPRLGAIPPPQPEGSLLLEPWAYIKDCQGVEVNLSAIGFHWAN